MKMIKKRYSTLELYTPFIYSYKPYYYCLIYGKSGKGSIAGSRIFIIAFIKAFMGYLIAKFKRE